METEPDFFAALLKIIGIDIVLSGDNAVVIALACRSLPPEQRRWGIILGAGTAIALRVIFAIFIIYLLEIPYLKIVGAALLLWIAIKLVLPETDGHGSDVKASTNLFAAVRTIAIADAVMSLDNVIAIAGAAHGSVLLLVLGLLISIPLIIFGSTMIIAALDRYPVLIYAGAGLLGWVAGEMLVTDPSVAHWVESSAPWLHYAVPAAAAAVVVIVGYGLAQRLRGQAHAARLVGKPPETAADVAAVAADRGPAD